MKKNCENKNEVGISDIISDIKNESKIIKCEDTGKKWIRNCPRCNGEIYYNNIYERNRSAKKNKQCKSCCKVGSKNGRFGKGFLISGSNHPMYKRHHSNKSKLQMSLKRKEYCLKHPEMNPSKRDDVNAKKSISLTGKNNPMWGKCGSKNPMFGKHFKHSDETIRRMRIRRINEITDKNGFCFPNFNPKSVEYFKLLEKDRGWNGCYVGKNKEYLIEGLGYFVDYYEPNLNIVVEYDEQRHYVHDQLKEKDVKRMNEIKNYLHCRFLRYNEKNKELIEYNL
jgi:hypothetical protein